MASRKISDCPKVEKINESLRGNSYEDRLKAVEEEANSLYAFCIKKGFSDKELLTCVSSMYGQQRSSTKQALNDSFKSFIFVAILVGTFAVIYASPTAQTLIAAHYKLAMIKFVKPYWNFGELYIEDCLISNPWLPPPEEPKATNESCLFCSNIVNLNNNTIDRVGNAKSEDILKFYIGNIQPVVITDVMKDWESIKPLTMDELGQLYQHNTFFQTYMGSCDYNTTTGITTTFYDFISAYVDKTLPEKWHANWENCEAKAAKVIRKYYKRPYYLPEMAQAGSFNSIIAAKGDHPNSRFSIIREASLGRWWTVLSGEMNIYLTPTLNDCIHQFGCKEVSVPLRAGESLLFYPDSWSLEYSITSKDMTIAVTSSLVWDKM